MWTSWVTHSMVTGLHQTEERMSGGKLVFCILITEDYFNFFKGTSLKKILKKRKKKRDFSSGSVVKNPSANAGDEGSVPRLGRSPGGGNSNLLQYCCLENPKDRRAWWDISLGSQSWSQTRLSIEAYNFFKVIGYTC